ncbi:MAG: MFS transporter [Negativicutes bacterium]|nr:MFS transporter [Negativicutes bacterium]
MESKKTAVVDQAMQKATKKIIPFLLLMFIFAYLDRINIGFAKQALQIDVGFSDAVFALGVGLFFIGYAVFEVPSNVIMHHVGARRWLSRIMVTWGIVAAGFAFVTDETMFYVLRILLGIAEAGFAPGIIYYISCWFTIRKRTTIMGLFLLGMPVSVTLGAPLSGFLLDMNGLMGLHGWQWMFLIEGLLASVVGVYALWYLVDKPEDAKWMTQEEKQALRNELEAENACKNLTYTSPWRALIDLRVLYLCFTYITLQMASYGITFYLPTQVAGLLGKKVGTEVGLVSAIPYACAIVALILIPIYSDRTGKKGSLAALLFGGCGVFFMLSNTANPFFAILALCVAVVCLFGCMPIFWTMPSRILTGVTAASGIAFINSIGNLGGFLAPNFRVWAEQYFHNPVAGIYVIGITAVFGSLLMWLTVPLGMGSNINDRK